jgi:drug/metabolite transporter (DMT)-like permease
VNPVIAVFLGWLVLGETVTLQTIIAAGVILIAVLIINTKLAVFRQVKPPLRPATSTGVSAD